MKIFHEMKELKALRLKQEKRQSELANKIGCSERQFRRYENGECAVPFIEAVLWAKALKLSLTQFLKLYREEK